MAAAPTIPSERREREAKARSKAGEIISIGWPQHLQYHQKRERERDTYLGMRRKEPLLRYPGFNALFYTTCPGGHQRSPTSPM